MTIFPTRLYEESQPVAVAEDVKRHREVPVYSGIHKKIISWVSESNSIPEMGKNFRATLIALMPWLTVLMSFSICSTSGSFEMPAKLSNRF